MKKILVMGGTGFIGSNICEYLCEKEDFVSVYGRRQSNLGNISYIGNIIDDEKLVEIISKYDVLVYLINAVSPSESMENPTDSYTKNIPLLLKTLDACVKSNVKRVVFASSGGTIYGDSNGIKSKETDCTNPQNHYAICKLTCEKILLMYNKLYEMENISLRISNPYGNYQDVNSGIGAITAFTNQILNNNPINLYGDGIITRDFVDVKDVAQAFYLASHWEFGDNITPIFNIGSGEGLSLIDIIKIISEALEIEPKINFLPRRGFDVEYNVLEIDKAKRILKYTPIENQREEIKKYVKKLAEKASKTKN